MTVLLELDEVSVRFGGLTAVGGVSLSIREGRFYGLVGPNGSGKTTLVNAVSGLGPLSAGNIRLDGAEIGRRSVHYRARAGVARTFQSIRLLPTLSVRENVQLAADRLGPDQAADSRWSFLRSRNSDLVGSALKALALVGVSDRLPSTLPYGTLRRVEIARALVGRPRILLLDEPVAGMNDEERQEIADTMRSLANEGLTQLVIEHDLRLLLSLCDELIVMNSGQLLARGEPAETAALPIVQEAYLGRRSASA